MDDSALKNEASSSSGPQACFDLILLEREKHSPAKESQNSEVNPVTGASDGSNKGTHTDNRDESYQSLQPGGDNVGGFAHAGSLLWHRSLLWHQRERHKISGTTEEALMFPYAERERSSGQGLPMQPDVVESGVGAPEFSLDAARERTHSTNTNPRSISATITDVLELNAKVVLALQGWATDSEARQEFLGVLSSVNDLLNLMSDASTKCQAGDQAYASLQFLVEPGGTLESLKTALQILNKRLAFVKGSGMINGIKKAWDLFVEIRGFEIEMKNLLSDLPASPATNAWNGVGYGAMYRSMSSIAGGRPQSYAQTPTKELSHNQSYRFTFEPASGLPQPTLVDRAKCRAEQLVGQPIAWWPLKAANPVCPSDHIRISWACSCRSKLAVDVPTSIAEDYQIRFGTVQGAVGPILPTHRAPTASLPGTGTSSTCQGSPTSGATLEQNIQRRKAPLPDSKSHHAQHAQLPGKLIDRYIHWCVDARKAETHLVSIPVSTLHNGGLVPMLKSAYNAVRGYRRLWSLKGCCEVKLVAFKRAHLSKEIVACGRDNVPCLPATTEYEYDYYDPQSLFIEVLETNLQHQIQNSHRCSEHDALDILPQIPKKINSPIAHNFEEVGYGMRAITGFVLWKVVLALIVSQTPAMGFAAWWLYQRPWDLQNALTPAVLILGYLTIILVIPDVKDML